MKKTTYSTALLLTVASVAGVAGAAYAQAPTSQPGHAHTAVTTDSKVAVQPSNDGWKSDKDFVGTAAESGNAEVAMGQLGVKRGTNPQVKSFAQRMINDHTKANQELKGLADKKGLSVTSGHNDKHHETMNHLAQLTGAEFDREYMKAMLKDHDKVVDLFQAEADKGTDAEVKAWASKTLPTLREHETLARDIAATVGAVSK